MSRDVVHVPDHPYDHEEEETMHAVARTDERPLAVVPTAPGKMTAARLATVEKLQGHLRSASALAAELVIEEENGWVPGTPQQLRTHRVAPLEALANGLADQVAALEALYA